MASQNSFNTRTPITVGGDTLNIFSLPALEKAGFPNVAPAAVLAEDPAREPAAPRGRAVRRSRRTSRRSAGWDVMCRGAEGDLPSRRRACCCRTSPASRRWSISRPCATASCRLGGDPDARSTRSSRSSSSSITRCRSTTLGSATPLELNAELEFAPQPRALHVPALGPGGLRQLPRRAARHRHRPPGQPRVPRAGRSVRETVGRPRAGVSRHAGRHRLAHHDGQRPWRGRLGRRRHRGRGGDAGPADLDADSAGRSASAWSAACPKARPRPTSC